LDFELVSYAAHCTRKEVTGMAGKKSSGGKARSAISGRYVKKSTAKKNPKTTVVEHDKKKK
jgi:hypothetical protein